MIEATRAVTPQEEARLLTKIWRARVYLNSCPIRKALNNRWRCYYRNNVRRLEL